MYQSYPTKDALLIELEQLKGLSDKELARSVEALKLYHSKKNESIDDLDYFVDVTEKWVQDSAFFNVLLKASDIIQNDKDKVHKTDIPEKMKEALAISFDMNVGLDFLEDSAARWDMYNQVESRLPFLHESFNKITKGGLPSKTLNVFMSTNTGGFKSGTMCDFAAGHLMMGKNVLYITMEMAQERIAERIDANILQCDIDDLKNLPKLTFIDSINKLKKKTTGKLVIKEYPTSSANANHFRFLLKELKIKKSFVPDVIYIDYLNICSSSRLPNSASQNSYLYIKAIAEELRGLAVEFDVPIISATQSGRSAAGASDIEVSDVSESYGLPVTCDLFMAIITTEQLDALGQIQYKQLKNRYADIAKNRSFNMGVKKSQMRLFELTKTIDDINKIEKQDKTFKGESANKFSGFKFEP